MDGKANLPVPPTNPTRHINPDTTSSSSSSFSSSSSPEFLRNVQAALKRHRPIGTMQSNSIRPRRMVAPQQDVSSSTALNVARNVDEKKLRDDISFSHGYSEKDLVAQARTSASHTGDRREDALITPPSISGTLTTTFIEGFGPSNAQENHSIAVTDSKDKVTMSSLCIEPQNIDAQKKVQFSIGGIATSQEMEWAASHQPNALAAPCHDSKNQNFQNMELEVSSRSEGGITSLLSKRTAVVHDQLQQFRSFLNQPSTQSSVAGPFCATTTSVHSTSAPMLNSTTQSHSHRDNGLQVVVEPVGELNVNPRPVTEDIHVQSSNISPKDTAAARMIIDQSTTAIQASTLTIDRQVEFKDNDLSKVQEERAQKDSAIPKNPCYDDKPTKSKDSAGDVSNLPSQAALPKHSSSQMKLEPSKLEKQEKAASSKGASVPRRRSYDPDLFFKVNGKLYQRLGKIGSGGSSEVHKVISSDCTIYALKKIKLKGRDYATAYGFCQEIEYLNRLKGKNNIIQLIDYEVLNFSLKTFL